MWYVYILSVKDGYYIGCTNDLKQRIIRHQNGHVTATKNRRPLELQNYIAFQNKHKAFEFEIYLKSGSGRAFCKKHFAGE